MKHRISHDLGLELARLATARALESYREQFPEAQPEGRWVGEDRAEVAFSVAGKRLKGQIDVALENIDIELDLPLIFRPFQKQAMAVIEEEIEAWLTKARNGELG
ncbi:MAG: hypothetical protein ACI9VR_004543 [Cognaticolwellia sp.]